MPLYRKADACFLIRCSEKTLERLAERPGSGVEKITFVGGHPRFALDPELLRKAKESGREL